MTPDHSSFFRSLSAELNAQADRVRYLIGSAHWFLDGNHKEALLRGLFKRLMPSGTQTSRAFVVDGGKISKEQDLVVADCLVERPLFDQGDLMIVAPSSVLGAVSVKTKFKKGELRDAVVGLESIPVAGREGLWFGCYFFNQALQDEEELPGVAALFPRWLKGCSVTRNMVIRVSDNLLARISPDEVILNRCDAMATAFFVAHALNLIAVRRGVYAASFADALDRELGQLESHSVPLR